MGETRLDSEVDKLRIAVIGCGSIGRRRIACLQALGERDLLVYDSHEGQKADASATFDVPLAPRLDDLWNWRPEAALICTPPSTHLRLTYEAVDNGARAVFIEKPLAITLARWGTEATTMVACNWRFHAGIGALKRWLDDGLVGEVLSARVGTGYHLPTVRPDYRTTYAATTGATLDVGSHAVDLVIHLLGPATLRAAVVRPARTIGLACDGGAEMLLDHDSGATSAVHVSWLQEHYAVTVEVLGSQATARFDAHLGAVLWREGKTLACADVLFRGAQDEMYRSELRHFLDCARKRQPTCNPVSEAAKTLNILLEAKECAQSR